MYQEPVVIPRIYPYTENVYKAGAQAWSPKGRIKPAMHGMRLNFVPA